MHDLITKKATTSDFFVSIKSEAKWDQSYNVGNTNIVISEDHTHHNMESVKSDMETPPSASGEPKKNMNDRKASWAKLGRIDSLNLEAGRIPSNHSHSVCLPLQIKPFFVPILLVINFNGRFG